MAGMRIHVRDRDENLLEFMIYGRQHLMIPRASLRSLLFLTLLLRLLLPAAALIVTRDPAVFRVPDSEEYGRMAISLVRDGRFNDGSEPQIRRPPGYPAVLAIGLLLDHPNLFMILEHALLGCVTVYLAFRTGLLLLNDKRLALFCGFACACEPVMLVWSTQFMPETLLTTLVVVGVYALLKYLASRSLQWLLLAALAVCAAAYVKAIAYFLPLWVTAMLALWAIKQPERSRLLGHAAVFLATCTLLLGPWQVRNALVAGYFGFSTHVERTIYLTGAAVVTAQDGRSFQEARRSLDEEFHASSPPGYSLLRRRGIATVLAAPATYARVALKGVFVTLFDPGASAYLTLFRLHPEPSSLRRIILDEGLVAGFTRFLRLQPIVFWSSLGLALVLLPYLLLPACALFRGNAAIRTPMLVLYGIVFYFLLLSSGPSSVSRFRHPIMPLLSILAGCALVPSRSREPKAFTCDEGGASLPN